MEYSVKIGPIEQQSAACVILGVFNDGRLSASANAVNRLVDGQIKTCIQRGDLSGGTGQTVWIMQPNKAAFGRVLLVNCGARDDFSDKAYATVNRNAFAALRDTHCKDALVCLPELNTNTAEWRLRQTMQLAEHASYQFEQMKSKKREKYVWRKLFFLAADNKQAKTLRSLISQAHALNKGVRLTKDLGNLPANVCTPSYLAKQARALARKYPALTTKIVERAEMEKLGMGSLLCVAQGSIQAPKLIIMEYKGTKRKNSKPVALVGKGVTFDTGGISIKPSLNMGDMKYDMCGAASVFGAVVSAAEAKLPVHLVGVVGAVENMPSDRAVKPADIVTSMSGQTIEIINTDAEGRLVLCDAMTYVQKFYKPEILIDIATLTGAVVIGLGHESAGLFSNDDALAKELEKHSRITGDRIWRMPLWEEYHDLLVSKYADVMNCGDRVAGSATAATFLSRFVKGQRWAHLDIAGVADNVAHIVGGTGRPVPLLFEYLSNYKG